MTGLSTGLPSQEQVIELLDEEFARAGYEIEDVVVDASARPPRISVIADGDEPLDLDTIAGLSRRASELLDSVDVAVGYVLEVSSPGVGRPLTSEKHFRRAHGRKVHLTLSDGSALSGRLGAIKGGTVQLVLKQKSSFEVRDIPLGNIAKAVAEVEFSAPSARELELAGVDRREAGP